MFQTKTAHKIKTYFMFNFFSENRPIYDIMGKEI